MAKRGKVTQLPGAHVASGHTILVALGSDEDQVIWHNKTGHAIAVEEATFTPETAATGNTTNNFILQVKSRLSTGGAGANITAAKTYATGTDLTAFVADVLVVSTTAADVRVEDEEAIIIAKTETASGLELPAGVVTIVYVFI